MSMQADQPTETYQLPVATLPKTRHEQPPSGTRQLPLAHGRPDQTRPLESIRRLRASHAFSKSTEASPTMAPLVSSAAVQRGGPVPMSSAAQRTVSMDSTLSSLSSSTAPQPIARSQSATSLDITDVPTLIATAGSPEAAIAKLLQEKQSASTHTTQLWRLVEKQRAMILGLNKDLERTLKEKEKYRKRLKDILGEQSSRPPTTRESLGSASLDSQSPNLPASSPPLPTSTSLDSLPSGPSRPNRVQTSASASSLPGIPVRSSANGPKTPLLPDAPHVLSPKSFSSPNQRLRKEKPAPLDLSNAPTMLREASDSDETPPLSRGRKKTRADDDRSRETLAGEGPHKEPAQASSRSAPPPAIGRRVPAPADLDADPGLLSDTDQGVLSDTETIDFGSPQLAQVQTFQSMGQMVSADAPAQPKRHPVSLTVLSPGLPMSPRPGDRPMNSPMPRAMKQTMSSIPLSPRVGGQMPLSPRAPRQPIPMPPQTPLSFASPHLARAETYQALAATSMSDRLAVPSQSHVAEPEPSSYAPAPRSPGEVYRGFMSDQYPGLLLPPNALPSIYVKVDSSRLRPSRHSYMAPKLSEENPVITLAVFARSNRTQLWRVEKSLSAMSVFDQQIKTASNFRTKLPDRSLFTGHAPARMDARRNALSFYFDSMLDTPMDDQAAVIICGFLTADAIGPDMPEYFTPEPTNAAKAPVPQGGGARKDGYLTKRGKNFGGWKARYFVLDGPTLKYFEAPGGAILGSIKLSNAQIGKQAQNSTHHSEDDSDSEYRHAFLILEPKRKDSSNHVRHVLCAESDEERDSWVEALLHYVDQIVSPTALRKQDSMHAVRSPRLQKSMNDISSASSRQSDSSSMLRSIPYQATMPAEAPIIGPNRELATPSPVGSPAIGDNEQHHDSNHHPQISGPTNGTVIQNAESWGNKREPVTQTKDKKRSIFGFRGRSSSDTVPGSIPKDLVQSESPVLVRPVFGAPLAEAVEIAPPSDVPVHLPAVVYRSVEYLRAKNASSEEGIFRLSGSNIVIKALRERFNTEGDVKLLEGQYYDIHAVASLLKLYLRELPASILTREHHLEFLKGLDLDEKIKVEVFNVLVNKLPRANRELLDILSTFLREIVDRESVNKMSVRNGELHRSYVMRAAEYTDVKTVGIVFAPTLNIPAPLISLFVMENDRIFGAPIDITTPVTAYPVDTPLSGVTPESVRSPRQKPSSEVSTPSYIQTSFYQQSAPSSRDGYDASLASSQLAHKENGPIPQNDRFSGQTGSRATQLSNPMSKQAKRESNTLFMNLGPMGQREPALSRLREAENVE
ncbi:RhoGAP-domain-containing protein [Aureobasidium pullulans]|uniref:RhoGAP-domain-containing protein n=1 Tax=Aureobasidium pullulans TaxID=5580 RepID=A0A4T0CC55_AURPU|nr:RhoGAP-domain-containing protein [Aureobasidium pullulans]